MQRNFAWAAMCLLVTACGPAVDIPDNVPMLGKWRDETRVMSVQINGAAVDRSKVPGIPEDKVSESCIEPKMRDDVEMRELMGRNPLMEKCELKPIARNGAHASFSGICSNLPVPDMANVNGVVGLTGRAWESQNKVTLTMSVEAAVREKTGNGTMVRMDIARTMNRLGDC